MINGSLRDVARVMEDHLHLQNAIRWMEFAKAVLTKAAIMADDYLTIPPGEEN